jgi:purine-nucleoside phosphorylase
MNGEVTQKDIDAATEVVSKAIKGKVPEVAIVLGSGLGHLGERVTDATHIPYDRIPGFHVPTAPGHKGELVSGMLGGKHVLVQSGRFHGYEGYSADETCLPIRVFATLGIKTLIITNAAGGIRREFKPGTLMILNDHINLTGRNPLIGPVRPGETRFPDMTNPYDPILRLVARKVARERGIAVEEGVYLGLMGPTYETPAEVRMVATLGGDGVGMSTVLEVIVARARGMRCLGISTITNPGAGISLTPLNHEEVMETAAKVGESLGQLVEGILAAM